MKCQYSLKLNRSYFNLLTHLQVLYLLPVGYRIDRYPLSSLFYNISTTYYLVDETTYLSFSLFLSLVGTASNMVINQVTENVDMLLSHLVWKSLGVKVKNTATA